jgi:hypothetical protein
MGNMNTLPLTTDTTDRKVRDHVLAELRRLDLEGVLSAEDGDAVVRRDAYGGSLKLGLLEFSELAATVADGSGLRGVYLARDGYRDDSVLRAIDAELARCGITGYGAQHRANAHENAVAVTDLRGQELPRPWGDSHGRELLRVLGTLADGCGVADYSAALANLDDHWLHV